ncbi:MAG: alanine--tRNA ligase [Chlorobi bacterium]|nr:alanine--tRNA ligase [Chlorobiota bacterium]
MTSKQVRQVFFDFFESKKHEIFPSAPMVVKNDPTLMFTNAGMNQFKDIFLGNSEARYHRVANSQKCLRVSGKHNDLDEVGHDTYHHTMFEMLGNWSFGDPARPTGGYFKKEAIQYAWELLTDVYKIEKENLYVTVFGGDKSDGLSIDQEAYDYWKAILPEERILRGSKKDNFWEMGESGPCGPCSEIHIDIRDKEEKEKIPGKDLVNMDHPEVIEIWNLVFIEFNRKSDSTLEKLPSRHVDTGMGFERLNMIIQGKKSNYDTDIFQNIIAETEKLCGKDYGKNTEIDIAMRVVADHLRAVVFAIADGQLPSNAKAGYVIRRILRRAVRYAYTFLEMNEAFVYKLVPVLVAQMGDFFAEIKSQQGLIEKVIAEEEQSFLRTLSLGIGKFEKYISSPKQDKVIDGDFAFELYDTFGFPIDLTRLMAREKGWKTDMEGYYHGLEAQKDRSRKAAEKDTEDWVILKEGKDKTEFMGYDKLEVEVEIIRYRKVKEKKREFYQLVLDKTPFYAESGGQVGDRGTLDNGTEKIFIEDTQRENDLITHITKKIPTDLSGKFKAEVNHEKRLLTENNHSATHLMHAALRKVLGNHVEQKGSHVDENRLRFDFSHFSKLSPEELLKIEQIVNEKIRENIPLSEKRDIPMQTAIDMGAMALFGEKYGDKVRVITFDENYSVELCGGTHVPFTGQIGFFKIISESAIAAGVRRIEAITGEKAEEFIYAHFNIINELKSIFKNQKDVLKGVVSLQEQNAALQKELQQFQKEKAGRLKEDLKKETEEVNGMNFIAKKLDLDANSIRDLAFKLNKEIENLVLVLGSEKGGKAQLTVMISEELVKGKGLNAGTIIREIAREIKGGGGGQAHFATAGGKDPNGLSKAFAKAREIVASY